MKTAANNHRSHAAPADPIEALKTDLVALRRDLGKIASADTARNMLEGAKDRVKDMQDAATKQAAKMHKQLGETAGEHPVKTVLISAAAGVVAYKLLGWLMRR